jgi:hypothetical protein
MMWKKAKVKVEEEEEEEEAGMVQEVKVAEDHHVRKSRQRKTKRERRTE